jgi:hypothetical protein
MKIHLHIIRIQIQRNHKQNLFLLCVLEFHNTKDETPKTICGNNPPPPPNKKRLEPPHSHYIGFQPHNKLQKLIVLQ